MEESGAGESSASSTARPNFRRELYARSTDRSTVEDMADMVVHRFDITINHTEKRILSYIHPNIELLVKLLPALKNL